MHELGIVFHIAKKVEGGLRDWRSFYGSSIIPRGLLEMEVYQERDLKRLCIGNRDDPGSYILRRL